MAYKQEQVVPTFPTSVTASGTVLVEQYSRFTAYVKSGLVGTWQLQISADGTNWFNYGSAVTDTGYVECTAEAKYARINVTAYTSGTGVATIWGRYSDQGG